MRTLFVAASLLLTMMAVPVGSAADAEPCKPIDRKIVNGVIVTVEDDCNTNVDVKIQECIWGGYWETYGQEPATIRVYKCGPPTDVAYAGPCPSTHQLGVGTLTLGAKCDPQLDIKFYDCIWGGNWRSFAGGIVRVYTCDAAPPTELSTSARPCPEVSEGFWGGHVEVDASCNVSVWVLDSYRICRAIGMYPGGYTGHTVDRVTVHLPNCVIY